MEINPEHPATREMHDLWHKIVAILIIKMGVRRVLITTKDVEKLRKDFNDDGCVIFKSDDKGMELRLLPMKEARALAAKEKGWN